MIKEEGQQQKTTRRCHRHHRPVLRGYVVVVVGAKRQEEVAGFSASRWEDKSDNPSRKGCTFTGFFSSSFRGNWCGTHNGECKSAKATKERRRLALRKISLKLDAHRIMDTLPLPP